MSYRPHCGLSYLLVGYDPMRDLPDEHLARLVEIVVEGADLPRKVRFGKGQPAFDPRLLAKVLVYGYATPWRRGRDSLRLYPQYAGLSSMGATRYRTHCLRGHKFTEETTYLVIQKDGKQHRSCRICRQIAEEKRKIKRRSI